MKLVILGSGTCVPSLKRNASGYLIEASGMKILVDCGEGTLHQLERAGRSYRDIDAVFITHPHPDHVSGLLPLIHATLATPGFTREKDLLIGGPRGIKNFYDRCISSVIRPPKSFSIEFVEMEDKFELGGILIFTARTVHTDDSIAYRFEEDRKSVVITGDCDYDQGIIALAEECNLLIADCSYPDTMKAAGHMTPRECGMVAKKARAKKLLLSHLYPVGTPDSERVAECRKVFDGDVSLAEDLMEITLP
jgi:ribonuclease BN (tRNA processing enzyme)